MIVMVNLNAKIFELLDQKFDLVLLWISAHIPKFLVFVARYEFVNDSGNAIGNSYFRFVG
jgi:hypothetical protein